MRHPLPVLFLLAAASSAFATEASQPYIDKLKEESRVGDKAPSDGEPYIEEMRAKNALGPREGGSPGEQPYMDKLMRDTGLQKPAAIDGVAEPHLDAIRRNPDMPPTEDHAGQGHIESIKKGLELKAKFKGPVRNAAGISVATGGDLELSSTSAQANSFSSIYRPEKKYNPTVDVHYEHHFLRDHLWGAFGPIGRVGVVTARGTGRFSRRNEETDVKFSFLAIPVSGGIVYRAIQPRFFVPFGQLAVVGIPFTESRGDSKASRRGLAFSWSYTLGASVSMDWISRSNAWSRYDEYGILHTYLVFQMQNLRPLAGRVDFRSNTLMAGLNFEF